MKTLQRLMSPLLSKLAVRLFSLFIFYFFTSASANTSTMIFKGLYFCGQGKTELILKIKDDFSSGLFEFTAKDGTHGAFSMLGTLSGSSFSLTGDKWIKQPKNYVMVNLEGEISPLKQGVNGKVTDPSCTTFSAIRESNDNIETSIAFNNLDQQSISKTFTSRYLTTNIGDVIWDQETNMIWARCTAGMQWNGKTCTGSGNTLSASEANEFIKNNNNLGGFNDWKMPSAHELITLMTCHSGFDVNKKEGEGKTCKNPAPEGFANIDNTAFPRTGGDYWSNAGRTSVWDSNYVNFKKGEYGGNCISGCNLYLRMVRSTKLNSHVASQIFTVELPQMNWEQAIEDRKVQIETAKREAEAKRRADELRAEQERRAAEAAKAAAWKKLNASGAQAMYLQAGKAQRSGSISVNGVDFNASELYEAIVEKFPSSEYAVKASDQLNAMGRSERQSKVATAQANNSCNRFYPGKKVRIIIQREAFLYGTQHDSVWGVVLGVSPENGMLSFKVTDINQHYKTGDVVESRCDAVKG